mmetsp:Transcript_42448/g.96063  ORF Transcript_42448/g.96063 Transcript_42448/m.96063 type:complete len:380 (-) Transcript_42448:244-1383(-)
MVVGEDGDGPRALPAGRVGARDNGVTAAFAHREVSRRQAYREQVGEGRAAEGDGAGAQHLDPAASPVAGVGVAQKGGNVQGLGLARVLTLIVDAQRHEHVGGPGEGQPNLGCPTDLLVARRASVGAGPLPAHSALVPRARRGVARGPEEAADVEGLKVAEKVRQVHPVRPALLLQARREPGLVPKALRPAARGLGEAALPAGDAPRIPELKQAHVIHLDGSKDGVGVAADDPLGREVRVRALQAPAPEQVPVPAMAQHALPEHLGVEGAQANGLAVAPGHVHEPGVDESAHDVLEAPVVFGVGLFQEHGPQLVAVLATHEQRPALRVHGHLVVDFDLAPLALLVEEHHVVPVHSPVRVLFEHVLEQTRVGVDAEQRHGA